MLFFSTSLHFARLFIMKLLLSILALMLISVTATAQQPAEEMRGSMDSNRCQPGLAYKPFNKFANRKN